MKFIKITRIPLPKALRIIFVFADQSLRVWHRNGLCLLALFLCRLTGCLASHLFPGSYFLTPTAFSSSLPFFLLLKMFEFSGVSSGLHQNRVIIFDGGW